jgi:D-beta-D-heptose 7-phosphate kinase/D-beta-D-heptose 1-phosphate adenosyltransferase
VTIFDEDTPAELIQIFRPSVLVKGGDYEADSIVGAGEIKSWGGRVEIVPLVKGRSTTSMVNKARID